MPDQYNIMKANGEIMLGSWLQSPADAQHWLHYYKKDIGKPYPNGKGFYKDHGFHVVTIVGIFSDVSTQSTFLPIANRHEAWVPWR